MAATVTWSGFGFNLDDDEQTEDGVQQRFPTTKDCLVLLVDASEQMFTHKLNLGNSEETCFSLALQAIRNLMCQKCVSGDNDQMAVIVYNTTNTKNEHGFAHIVNWQPPDVPDVKQVKQLEEMSLGEENELRKKFEEEFGGSGHCEMDEVFWLAANLLSSSGVFGTRRVLCFTNSDSPYKASDMPGIRRAHQKLKDLLDQNVDVQLIPMNSRKSGGTFDPTKFWNLALGEDVQTDGIDTLAELLDDVRHKIHKRRSLGNIPFVLGEGLEFNVGLYNLISQARVPTAIKLDKTHNKEVKTVKSHFNQDTGEKLLDRDLQKFQEYGDKKIAFENEEVENVRRVNPGIDRVQTGVVLLGFKPITSLRMEDHVRPCVFLYPDEHHIRGSTTMFRCLLERCILTKRMPICRLRARRNMPARVVALLPQEEKRDGNGRLMQNAGFHAVYLPFADDVRDLTKITSQPRPIASDEQIAKAKAILKKFTLKNYTPEAFSNPVIAKHYKTVEAIALEHKQAEEVIDQTVPDYDRITEKYGGLIKEFSDEVYPNGVPGISASRRKAPSQKAFSAKKPKIDSSLINLEQEAKANRLSKLTVTLLKDLAIANEVILKSTKKADIIHEINLFYKIES